jgi:hypothetical protein
MPRRGADLSLLPVEERERILARRARARENYAAHPYAEWPEERRAHRLQYARDNKDKINAQARENYHANPGPVLARTAAWDAEHPEARAKALENYKNHHSDRRSLSGKRCTAAAHGFLWALSDECAAFLRWHPCWVCYKEGPGTLDRHDNSVKAYYDWNTRPMCFPCNASKHDTPLHEVDAWACKRRKQLGVACDLCPN